MGRSLNLRAIIVSALILLVFLGGWQLATLPPSGGGAVYADPEYAAMMGGAGDIFDFADVDSDMQGERMM